MEQILQAEKATLARPEGGDYLWLPWEVQELRVQLAPSGGRVGIREEAGR